MVGKPITVTIDPKSLVTIAAVFALGYYVCWRRYSVDWQEEEA
jgi:hypothetical protein